MHTINFLGFTSVWCYLVRVYIHLYVFFQIKVYINYGKCHVELVSMYLLCLYFSPGQFGNMKYWHFSSHWIDFIQIWPQTNGGPNTERYPAKKNPKSLTDTQNKVYMYIIWKRWNLPFLIYSFTSCSLNKFYWTISRI